MSNSRLTVLLLMSTFRWLANNFITSGLPCFAAQCNAVCWTFKKKSELINVQTREKKNSSSFKEKFNTCILNNFTYILNPKCMYPSDVSYRWTMKNNLKSRAIYHIYS